MSKFGRCNHCHVFGNLESCSCDHEKVFLCGTCMSEWTRIWKWSGLGSHCLGGRDREDREHYNKIWHMIFYAWIKNLPEIPDWEGAIRILTRQKVKVILI